MKKIGLATFYDDNFGTCLQAYALQKTLIDLGYDVKIIRYSRCDQQISKQTNIQKITRYSPVVVLKYIRNYKSIQIRKQAFADFRKNNLIFNENSTFYRDSDLSHLQDEYDVLVCGSDMMWSSQFKDDWYYYMLGFADKDKSIAYSPSFGRNFLTEGEIKTMSPLISNIKSLSCRELAGADLIKSNFGLEALHTADPTLLLGQKDWNDMINDKSSLIKGDYILTYSFLGTAKKGRYKIFNQFKSGEKGQLVILSGAEKEFKKYSYTGYAGPIEFVRLYRDCKFVITDTYHGLLFALIFKKPFIVLDKSPFGVTADRLLSTLKYLGLEDRYVTYDTSIDDRLLNLDYSTISPLMDRQRQLSIEYLQRALSNATK